MKILAFDSSNEPLTVAVTEEGQVLAEQIINIKRNHSIQLMPAIDEALKQAKMKVKDLDRIAVAAGPGSYTGLRIGLSVAKSLAWAQGIDLVAVSSLKVLAANGKAGAKELIVPLFDARRENLYTGLYQWNEAGELLALEEDHHLAAADWASFLVEHYSDYSFQIIGRDAEKFYPTFAEKLGEKAHLVPANQNLPRASALALFAEDEETVDPHTFTPTYLKLAEAEEDWLKEHPNFKGADFVERI